MAEGCGEGTGNDSRSFLIKDILELDKEPEKTSKEKTEGQSDDNDEDSPKCKRKRTSFSDFQIGTLEGFFIDDNYPDQKSREFIAQIVGIDSDRVQVWFQNRRARFRKREKHKTLQRRSSVSRSIRNHKLPPPFIQIQYMTAHQPELNPTGHEFINYLALPNPNPFLCPPPVPPTPLISHPPPIPSRSLRSVLIPQSSLNQAYPPLHSTRFMFQPPLVAKSEAAGSNDDYAGSEDEANAGSETPKSPSPALPPP